jgi:hypothetical protein
MAPVDAPPLRYLSSDDVLAAMPPLDERLALAERTMTPLASGAELPPKIGVHPRPEGSFAHAMPAHLRGADGGGADDLLGIKWVAGFSANAAVGRPAISALAILTTRRPAARGDPRRWTDHRARRQQAGAAMPMRRGRGPSDTSGPDRGRPGRSHPPVPGRPGRPRSLRCHRDGPCRAALARDTAGIGGSACTVGTGRGRRGRRRDGRLLHRPVERGPMTTGWRRRPGGRRLHDGRRRVARDAALVVDRGQFPANRDVGQLDGYPTGDDPGEAILAGTPRPPRACS